jgi:hypothetical protein
MGHPTEGQLPISRELAERLAPRILARVQKRPDGCWLRTVYVSPSGYSRIDLRDGDKRRWYYAHRVTYVLAHGPIPAGLTVDHICEVPACCNPDHLRAVPHRANVLRSTTNPYAINAAKERCLRDHEFTPHPSNPKWRHCLECNRIRQAEYVARKRAARQVS